MGLSVLAVPEEDEVNRSGSKIGADELPAVTRLFTEPYMVSFLLDNSLGAWWAARRLSESDLSDSSGEVELRQNAAIPGVPFDYLRFVRCEDTAGGEGGRLESTGVASTPMVMCQPPMKRLALLHRVRQMSLALRAHAGAKPSRQVGDSQPELSTVGRSIWGS